MSSGLLSTNVKQIQPVALCPACLYRPLPFDAAEKCYVCSDLPFAKRLYEFDVKQKEIWIKVPLAICAVVILFLCLIAILGIHK